MVPPIGRFLCMCSILCMCNNLCLLSPVFVSSTLFRARHADLPTRSITVHRQTHKQLYIIVFYILAVYGQCCATCALSLALIRTHHAAQRLVSNGSCSVHVCITLLSGAIIKSINSFKKNNSHWIDRENWWYPKKLNYKPLLLVWELLPSVSFCSWCWLGLSRWAISFMRQLVDVVQSNQGEDDTGVGRGRGRRHW